MNGVGCVKGLYGYNKERLVLCCVLGNGENGHNILIIKLLLVSDKSVQPSTSSSHPTSGNIVASCWRLAGSGWLHIVYCLVAETFCRM